MQPNVYLSEVGQRFIPKCHSSLFLQEKIVIVLDTKRLDSDLDFKKLSINVSRLVFLLRVIGES